MLQIQCTLCQHTFDSPIRMAGDLNFNKCKSVFSMSYGIKIPCPQCKVILDLQKTEENFALGYKASLDDQQNTQEKTQLVHLDQISKQEAPVEKNETVVKAVSNKSNMDKETVHLNTSPSISQESLADKTTVKPFKLLPQFMHKEKDFKLKLNDKKPSFAFNGNQLLGGAILMCAFTFFLFIFSLFKEKPLKIDNQVLSQKIIKKRAQSLKIEAPKEDLEIEQEERVELEESFESPALAQQQEPLKDEMDDTQEEQIFDDSDESTLSEDEKKLNQGGVSEDLSINQDTVSYETMPADIERYQKNLLILPKLKSMTSSYGVRLDPFTQKLAFHGGLDFKGTVGTPVKVALSGKVTHAAKKGRYGNVLIVEHENGYESRYAHLSKFLVNKGDLVQKGDIVAHIGSTGRSTGPHLHFELLKEGKKVNPLTEKLAFAQKTAKK